MARVRDLSTIFARAAHKIFLYRPYEFSFKPGGGQTVDSLFSRFIELLGRQEGDPSFEQFLEGLGISYTEIDILNRKSWFFECGAHMAFKLIGADQSVNIRMSYFAGSQIQSAVCLTLPLMNHSAPGSRLPIRGAACDRS